MNNYKVSYGINGTGRSRIYSAESEAEALEDWERDYEGCENFIEFVSCVELDVTG